MRLLSLLSYIYVLRNGGKCGTLTNFRLLLGRQPRTVCSLALSPYSRSNAIDIITGQTILRAAPGAQSIFAHTSIIEK